MSNQTKKLAKPIHSAGKPQNADWKPYVEVIRAAWQKGVEGFLETGLALIEAQAKLPFGTSEEVKRDQLPFNARTAERLMTIATNPVISNPTHASDLPSHWPTLYELTRVDKKLGEGKLAAMLKDGTITAKTQRKQVVALWKPPSGAGNSGNPPPKPQTTVKRTAYIEFLRSLLVIERYDELMALRTALGALGMKISVEQPMPPAIESEEKEQDEESATERDEKEAQQ